MATKAFNTGKFVEKVMAMSMYDTTILQDLYVNPINKQKINRGAALLIKNYFNQYLDSRARQTPPAYHHVYEFGKTGESSARLFTAVVGNSPDGSATITYSFTPAKDPNPDGYPFPNKAEVMENGETIVVTPKRSKYLKFEINDGQFVSLEKAVIRNPGGTEVKGSFQSTFQTFMAGQGNTLLQRLGYFQKIEQALINRRRMMIPRINSGATQDAIRRGKIDAMGIAGGVVSTYA